MIVPEKLYRCSTVEGLRIRNGCVAPHNLRSPFGESIPVTTESRLVNIACILFNQHVLRQITREDYFLIVTFNTALLKKISYDTSNLNYFQEYFVQAPLCAIEGIQKVQWQWVWDGMNDEGGIYKQIGTYDISLIPEMNV